MMGSHSNRPGTSTLGPDWLSVALALGGVLLLLYALPMVALFLSVPPGDLLARIDDPIVVSSATTSLLSASISTLLATAFGLPLAYWLARTQRRLAAVVTGVVVLPLVLPPVVSGLLLLSVVGAATPLGAAARNVGVPLSRYWGLDPETVPDSSFTIGIGDPGEMAAKAEAAADEGPQSPF